MKTLPLLAIPLAITLTMSSSANPRRHAGVRLATSPTIDGRIEAGEWPENAKLNQFVDPVTGTPVPDQTVGYLAFDDQAIYLAVRSFDSDPKGLIGREIAYGADFDDEDHITFTVNPVSMRTSDGRSTFRVSLINTQRDSIAGGRAAKREWRGEWQSATTRDDQGWMAEVRIPWEILQFTSGKGRTLDFNLSRFHARLRRSAQWSNQGIQQRPELLGYWDQVDLPEVKRKERPEFLAYLAPEYDQPDFRVNAGLDVRYALSPRTNALLSVNPDFRNIEGQITGIEFTRSERFVDETRPFFNEGNGFFNLTGGFSFGSMFYSQRIPRFDVGTKFYGNLSDRVKLGVLATHHQGRQTATVANLAVNPGPNGSSNVYATHVDDKRRSNTSFGGNYWTRKGNWSFDVQYAGEQDTNGLDSASATSVSYEAPNFFSVLRYSQIEPKFSPELGFVPFTDRRGAYWYSEYDQDIRQGPLQRWGWDLFFEKYQTYDGDNFSSGGDLAAYVLTRSDIRLRGSVNRTDFFNDDDRTAQVSATFNDNNRFKRYGFSYRKGTLGGEKTEFTNVFGSLRVGKIDLGASYSLFEANRTNRQIVGTVGWEIDARQTVSGRIVQRQDDTNIYFSYRLAGTRGMETFVILGDPNSNETQSRLSLKFVWAF